MSLPPAREQKYFPWKLTWKIKKVFLLKRKGLKLSNSVYLLSAMAVVQQDALSPHGALISNLSVDTEAPTAAMVTKNHFL